MVKRITQGVVTVGLVGTTCYLWATVGEAPVALVGAMMGVPGWVLREETTKGGGK